MGILANSAWRLRCPSHTIVSDVVRNMNPSVPRPGFVPMSVIGRVVSLLKISNANHIKVRRDMPVSIWGAMSRESPSTYSARATSGISITLTIRCSLGSISIILITIAATTIRLISRKWWVESTKVCTPTEYPWRSEKDGCALTTHPIRERGVEVSPRYVRCAAKSSIARQALRPLPVHTSAWANISP